MQQEGGVHRLRAPPRRTGRREHSGADILKQKRLAEGSWFFYWLYLAVGISVAYVICTERSFSGRMPDGSMRVVPRDLKKMSRPGILKCVPGRDFLFSGSNPDTRYARNVSGPARFPEPGQNGRRVQDGIY